MFLPEGVHNFWINHDSKLCGAVGDLALNCAVSKLMFCINPYHESSGILELQFSQIVQNV